MKQSLPFGLVLVAVAMAVLPTTADAARRRARAPVAAPVYAPVRAPAAPAAYPYETAPWWANQNVVTQTGYAYTELPANRAAFTASFVSTDKSLAKAQAAAIDKTHGLQEALGKLGRDQVVVTTGFSMRALYEQYRDRNGNMIENRRGDKINGYEVSLTISVEVRDLSRLEQAYALVLAAAPTSAGDIGFSLQPSNQTNTQLYTAAIKDARERAGDAATAAGVTLGKVRMIDPTGRACQSDILAAGHGNVADAMAIGGADYSDSDVSAGYVTVTGKRTMDLALANAAPPPPPPGSAAYLEAQALKNPFIQTPPLQRLETQACVVYSLD